jgi:serine/threonine-protein kinase
MELLEGETLEERLQRMRVLPPNQVANIMTHVARAVAKAHEAGVIHRDLKPGNIFLVKNDDEEMAKVLDFGIAKFARGGARATQAGTAIGTPTYMSPEQIQALPHVDFRTDLWALAVLAFECLTGQAPFQGDAIANVVFQICLQPLPVPSSRAVVPPGFDAWFAKGASRNPDDRFQSAKELAESLRAVLCADPGASQQIKLRVASALALGPTVRALPEVPVPGFPTQPAIPVPAPIQYAAPAGTHRGLVSVIQAPPRRTPWALLAGLTAGIACASIVTAILIFGRSRLSDHVAVELGAEGSPAAAPSDAPAPPDPAQPEPAPAAAAPAEAPSAPSADALPAASAPSSPASAQSASPAKPPDPGRRTTPTKPAQPAPSLDAEARRRLGY